MASGGIEYPEKKEDLRILRKAIKRVDHSEWGGERELATAAAEAIDRIERIMAEGVPVADQDAAAQPRNKY